MLSSNILQMKKKIFSLTRSKIIQKAKLNNGGDSREIITKKKLKGEKRVLYEGMRSISKNHQPRLQYNIRAQCAITGSGRSS